MTDFSETEKLLAASFASKNGRALIELLEAGYRGSFVTLRILAENGNRMTAGELAKKTGVTTARVAAILKSLSKKNYVVRVRSENDGRSVVVTLTPEGLRALKQRRQEVHSFMESLLKKLSDGEKETFVKLFTKLFSRDDCI